MTIRLLVQGEGRAAVELAADTSAPGVGSDAGQFLRDGLDRHGGVIDLGVPQLEGATGWCFGVFENQVLVAVLYACTPVDFVCTFAPQHRAVLAKRLVEVEILATHRDWRGRGVGTRLIEFVDRYFADRDFQLIMAKVSRTDMPVLRWYRHRGYVLARPGESCYLDTPAGPAGINAGPDADGWRLAVKPPGRTASRQDRGPAGFVVT